jgi:hypothetical protein
VCIYACDVVVWPLNHPQLEQDEAPTKYIMVTGGVISGIGKGIIASSMGTILKSCGIRVTSIKIDPYLNIGLPGALVFLSLSVPDFSRDLLPPSHLA